MQPSKNVRLSEYDLFYKKQYYGTFRGQIGPLIKRYCEAIQIFCMTTDHKAMLCVVIIALFGAAFSRADIIDAGEKLKDVLNRDSKI